MYTKHKWNSDRYFNFPYIQYLPEGFEKGKKYPLVFFLHGAGERGDDLEKPVSHGFMKYVREQDREYPFIFIGPQCPENRYWGCYTESLLAFLDDICEKLPVDRNRIYLTGLSMGGTGSFMLAMAAPKKFAAVAPVCGSGICWYAETLKDTPVRMYHGDLDKIVPIEESITMLKRINAFGNRNAELVICYGVDHNAWDYAYVGDELVEWFLQHRLADQTAQDCPEA